MYQDHYRFSSMPFQLTPDSRFFFGSKGHSRAMAHLSYGLSQGEGFIVVTGEVGAGKTTLVERLWSQLDRATHTIARVNTTKVSGDDLFRLAMAGFGITEPGSDKSTLLLHFAELLRSHRQTGRRCLLVIDEVQNLSVAALEELRMLSNLTEDGHASLQTVLLGQPQFRRTLASPELDQLRQRVIASYHLEPLGREETRAYIEHRLAIAGWTGYPSWDDDAFAATHRHTDGVPRRINRLCSRVLLYGALEESLVITGATVETAAQELRADLEGVSFTGVHDDGRIPASDGRDVASLDDPAEELYRRIEAVEHTVARRERQFRRLMDAVSQGRPI